MGKDCNNKWEGDCEGCPDWNQNEERCGYYERIAKLESRLYAGKYIGYGESE